MQKVHDASLAVLAVDQPSHVILRAEGALKAVGALERERAAGLALGASSAVQILRQVEVVGLERDGARDVGRPASVEQQLRILKDDLVPHVGVHVVLPEVVVEALAVLPSEEEDSTI